MNFRMHAALVITKRRIFESLISPGYYITQTVGLLISYLLIAGFINSIDSSGFNYTINPFFQLIGNSLTGTFGSTFMEKLFAEGPFRFILYISIVPVFLYLSLSTLFHFGLEKKVGAIELLTYGPVDGSSYFLSFFIRDVVLTAFYLLILILFLSTTAIINNLVLGSAFFYTIAVIFFMMVFLYAISIIPAVLTDSGATAITLFIAVNSLFLIIMLGSFTLSTSYVSGFSSILSLALNWFSPFYYLVLALSFIEAGLIINYFLVLLAMVVLSLLILLLSHFIFKAKGVRG